MNIDNFYKYAIITRDNIGEDKRFVYQGWVRTKETKPIHFIFNKFKIEIYD